MVSGAVHEQKKYKITDHGYKISFFRITKISTIIFFDNLVFSLETEFEESKIANGQVRATLHIANRLPKSLSIADSDHSEDTRLKIT